MSHLELKIPPAILVLVMAPSMWLASRWTPGIPIPEPWNAWAFGLLGSLGALVAISGSISFRRAKTTFNPMRPDAASTLVTSGIYRVTRNPMYLGILFALLGWGLFLSNLGSLLFCGVFVLYMSRFQIQPEERALEVKFGVAFIMYKSRVRRWL